MNRGFTLIELLIVIGIISVLATTVLLVLNPARILAEARDTQRLQDFDTVLNAVQLTTYRAARISDVVFDPGPNCTPSQTVANPFNTGGANCIANSDRTNDGTGWMGVDLTASFTLSGGQIVLPVLPMDPTNNTTYFYGYKGNNTSKIFELNARLESEKHRDRMKNDGGDDNTCTTYTEVTCFYEKGTSLTL